MLLLYVITIVLLVDLKPSLELSCKNEKNEDVDWFIVYKLPNISRSNVSNGKAYTFITSTQTKKWKLGSPKITSKKSLLGRTWQNLKDNEEKATYLFYNDDPPDFAESNSVGHLKGLFGFDEKTGFWLTHSIPKFGNLDKYEYPDNAVKNGQYALCITFEISQLKKICNHLLYCHPNIYLKKITEEATSVLDEDERSLFTNNPAFIKSPPFLKTTNFTYLGDELLRGFAKDNQFIKDIYSDIIAPSLQTSLMAETWRRGQGTILQPSCLKHHTVIDITTIEMSVRKKRRKHTLTFNSTLDHSKWAISTDAGKYWTCFSDLNRMKSQFRRGGGALCFSSKTIWKLFRSLVSDNSKCPV